MDSKWKMICGPLNSFILIAVTATNQDIQAAERRLPSIGNSCTVPSTTTTSDIVLTNSIPPTSVLSTRDGNRQLTTTLPIDSDDITSLRLSSPVTEESSDESDADGKFLSLSLLEFILVASGHCSCRSYCHICGDRSCLLLAVAQETIADDQ